MPDEFLMIVQIAGMIFKHALGMMSFLCEILCVLEFRVCLKKFLEIFQTGSKSLF